MSEERYWYTRIGGGTTGSSLYLQLWTDVVMYSMMNRIASVSEPFHSIHHSKVFNGFSTLSSRFFLFFSFFHPFIVGIQWLEGELCKRFCTV